METSSVSPKVKRHFMTRKRLAISLGVIMLAIALFGLLGYYWLPGYAKTQIETILSGKLNRAVTIDSIAIQPYTLELTVLGFQIAEKNDAGSTFFAFDRLYVDVSIESIRYLAPVVRSVTLTAPRLHLVREDTHRFNISDLIEQFKSPPEDPVEESSREALFSVSNISIQGGAIEFEDRLKNSRQDIEAINLNIPFIANFESAQIHWVEPHLSAQVNGAPLALEGKLRPFADRREATLSLKFNDIDLTDIDEYSPIPTGIRLLAGSADSDISLTFAQAVDEAPSIRLSGQAALKELIVENKAVKAPYRMMLNRFDVTLQEAVLTESRPIQTAIKLAGMTLARLDEAESSIQLPGLDIEVISVDRAQQHIALGPIILDGANARVNRQADGQLDLLDLFAPVAVSVDHSMNAVSPPSSGYKQFPSTTIPLPDRKPIQATNFTRKTFPSDDTPSAQAAVPLPDHKPSITSTNLQATESERGEKIFSDDRVEAENSKAWTVHIDQIILKGGALRFEDHTLTKPMPMTIESLDLTIDNINLSGSEPLDLSLKANVNQRGSIEAQGAFSWAPLMADFAFDLKQIDLVPLQGWGGDHLNALISRGELSFQGNVNLEGEPFKVTLSGQSQLTDFNVLDKTARANELLRWKNIGFAGIQFVNEPLRVAVASVELADFYARVILLPDKKLNLHSLVRQEEVTPTEVAASTEPASQPNEVDSSAKAPLPVYIDKVILRNGRINFADQFIEPHYRANLTGLKGQIGPLHPGKSGKIDLRGSFDRSAPLHISGTIEPFSGELFLDIMSTVSGIDLPTFSPYSGRYLGYVIEKGKLSFDVNYHVEKGELKAKNNIFLDQLDLGEEIESPDAASLPIKLAISLLKNRQGEIDIRLPLSGSINDPQFSITGIIWEAFVNLITKAITAPFALLGSLLDEGEQLSEVTFPAGYATIEPESEKRLQVLSEALVDRPALKLEITGFADPANDHDALKKALLERMIKTQKISESVKKGQAVGPVDEIALNEEEYERYLTMVYKETDFEKPKNFIGLTKSLPVAEMEQLILTHTQIGDNELHALAQNRAGNVLQWLVEQGGVSSERVFVLGTKVEISTTEQPNSRVVFSVQ